MSAHPFAEDRARNRLNRAFRDKWLPAKLCKTCLVVKSTKQFSKHNGGKSYQSECKACQAETDAKWYAENADRKREYLAKWRAENADRRREYLAKWRAENADRNAGRVQDPNATKACRKCGEILPETSFSLCRVQLDGLRRECRDCDSSPYRKACQSLHGAPEKTTCHLCGLPNTDLAHADHLLPISKGGPDEGWNLHWAHPRCNISRQDKPLTAEQISRLPESCTYVPFN